MKKILFVIDTIDLGGATKLTFDFISKIKDKQYDVKIYYLNKQKFSGKNTLDFFDLKNECQLIWYEKFRIIRRLIFFYNNFRKFDLVHSCMEQSNFYTSLVRLIPFSNFKHIVTYHGLDSVYTRDFKKIKSNSLRRYFYVLIMKYFQNLLYKKTDAFIGVCNAIQKYLIESRNVNVKKTEVIYHGLNLEYFNSMIREINDNKKLFNEDNVFIVGYIGRLAYGKGLEELIKLIPEIIAKEKNFRFIFKGEGELRAYLENKIDELKIKDYARIDKFEKNVFGFYKNINLLILPSFYETTNLTVLESMYSKTPVLASDAGGIPEIIDDGKNGFLFETGNFEMLKSKLFEINKLDPEKLQSIIDCGYKTILNKFNMELNFKKILQKFESVSAKES